MRPNIEISHTLNGRVKDYASRNGMNVPEAYRKIILAGLDAVDDETNPDPEPNEDHNHDVEETGDDLREVLENWDPTSEVDDELAKAETERAARYLQQKGGRFSRSELVDAIGDESRLSDRSWWERAVQPGLKQLRDADLVEYRKGYHDYQWRE